MNVISATPSFSAISVTYKEAAPTDSKLDNYALESTDSSVPTTDIRNAQLTRRFGAAERRKIDRCAAVC